MINQDVERIIDDGKISFRLEKEIQNFTKVLEDGGVASSIPPIFTYWASKYLSPRLHEVFGEVSINSIFAKQIFESYNRICDTRSLLKSPFRILSLGSGDCTTETAIVKILVEFGCSLEFIC